jgi:hypothetical protein
MKCRHKIKTALIGAALIIVGLNLLKFQPEGATTYEDVGDILRRTWSTHNSIKILESQLRLKAFIFSYLIGLADCQVFKFFRRAVRPIDHRSLNSVILP